MVECAMVLPVMFIILFAMLDLGLAAARYNALSDAARRIARQAIIHGSIAPAGSSIWGPAEFSGTAADGSELVRSAQNVLLAMPPNLVSVHISWPDGDNVPLHRVNVEVSFVHQPLIPKLFAWAPLNLRATATMRIVN
jgi:hypothetical protein